MNRPDEATIKSWLQGELEGDALRQMEAWAEQNAETLEKEMGWDTLSEEISTSLPASETPPYADFFNERVKHHAVELESPPVESKSLWQRISWALAPAALACLAIGYLVGTSVEHKTHTNITSATPAINEVYTPADGVSSEVIESNGVTVIVLDGLDEIPDSLDIVAGETSEGVSPRMLVKAQRTNFYL